MKRVIAVIWKQFPTRCITVFLHIALKYDFLTFHHSLQQSSLAARQQSVRTCKSLQHELDRACNMPQHEAVRWALALCKLSLLPSEHQSDLKCTLHQPEYGSSHVK